MSDFPTVGSNPTLSAKGDFMRDGLFVRSILELQG